MPRPLSNSFKTNLNLISSAEHPIITIEINHANLVSPVRLVGDTKDIVSNGENYIACPFEVSILSDSDKERPKATLRITNIGRALTRWIEQTHGAADTTVTMRIIRRSEPDMIEYDVTVDFTQITVTTQIVSGTLSFENLYRKSSINKIYSPKTAPGIHNSALD